MTQKVIIVGHPEIKAEIISGIGCGKEVVFIENKEDLNKLIGTDISELIPPPIESFVITPIPRIIEPTILYNNCKKVKGHIRPYKYHR